MATKEQYVYIARSNGGGMMSAHSSLVKARRAVARYISEGHAAPVWVARMKVDEIGGSYVQVA